MVQPVPDRLDFPKNEEEILEYWKSIDAFQKSLKLAKGRPRSVPVQACTIIIPTQQGMDELSRIHNLAVRSCSQLLKDNGTGNVKFGERVSCMIVKLQ